LSLVTDPYYITSITPDAPKVYVYPGIIPLGTFAARGIVVCATDEALVIIRLSTSTGELKALSVADGVQAVAAVTVWIRLVVKIWIGFESMSRGNSIVIFCTFVVLGS